MPARLYMLPYCTGEPGVQLQAHNSFVLQLSSLPPFGNLPSSVVNIIEPIIIPRQRARKQGILFLGTAVVFPHAMK